MLVFFKIVMNPIIKSNEVTYMWVCVYVPCVSVAIWTVRVAYKKVKHKTLTRPENNLEKMIRNCMKTGQMGLLSKDGCHSHSQNGGMWSPWASWKYAGASVFEKPFPAAGTIALFSLQYIFGNRTFSTVSSRAVGPVHDFSFGLHILCLCVRVFFFE